MPNGAGREFEEMLLPRLEETARDEASAYVLEARRHGDDLGTAVIDAVESLPARKTRRLRSWVDQATAFSEWKALERQGWEIERFWANAGLAPSQGRFAIFTPDDQDLPGRFTISIADAVAAAVGASFIEFVGTNKRIRPGRTAYIFGVNKTT